MLQSGGEMMEICKNLVSALRLCAWGMIFILLDINLNIFDILPDILGWVLLLSGISRIAKYRAEAAHLRIFALLLLANSVIEFFENIFGGKFYPGFYAVFVLVCVISLYFYFAFFTCIAAIAREYSSEREKGILWCRNIYSAVFCFNTVVSVLEMNYTVLNFVGVLINVVMMVAICFFVFLLSEEVSRGEDKEKSVS